MDIISLCNRELTDSEQNSINQINGYLVGDSSYVLITDKVGIFYTPDEIENKTIDEIIHMTKENIHEMLSNHPDFSAYFMNDGHGLVFMMHSIFGITELLSDKEQEEENVSLKTAMETRLQIMKACEEEKFIAFVRN